MTDRDKLVELITELAAFKRNVELLRKVVLSKMENTTIEPNCGAKMDLEG